MRESRDGRPGLPVPGTVVPAVSVDIKHHQKQCIRVQELCESPSGRPGLLSLISLQFLET